MKYPLKMIPAFKDYIWGGTRLKDEYNKKTDLSIVAESWEVSCHPDGQSIVDNGVFKGQTLAYVLKQHPEWMGSACEEMTEFPLLIKLIDARESLSLQVHPGDEYARTVENQAGKNEMWYIAEAEPGAELILGFKKPMDKDELKTILDNNEMMSAAQKVPVSAGDCYCIPAGMLHAIGAGIMIIEVQQNSNVTYRVYDFDRVDANGNLRELHINKAADVLDTKLMAKKSEGSILANWQYFKCEILTVNGSRDCNNGEESFQCLTVINGELTIEHNSGENPHGGENPHSGEIKLNKGETVFIPAGTGEYSIHGTAELLTVHL